MLLLYARSSLLVTTKWQLRQEKVDLENQLEREQEYVVNKLSKQLAQVRDPTVYFSLARRKHG